MKNPAEFLTYSERPAVNCNRDPKVVNLKFDRVRAMRDRAARMLLHPRLIGQDRREIEMIHAKADRLLRGVEAHRQGFIQSRLLAKVKPL